MKPSAEYDVIVIGAGHAGCEAALASARLGARTLLLTINVDHTAQMSCNPAIGGIAKGHLVREIDALGGEMGLNADASNIQFRMLNRSKGPAVWSPRAQCDKLAYQRRMQLVADRQENLFTHQAQAVRFVTKNDRVAGVVTQFKDFFTAKAVVVATGTFLNARLHYGMMHFPGGRAGDEAAVELSRSLREDLQLEVGRLKTGTPPRILARSVDFKSMICQPPEDVAAPFSFRRQRDDIHCLRPPEPHQVPCYVTNSTEKTAEIIRDNLEQSPMYSGKIQAIGTRYCPSFEDKVVRFPHHPSHQIYLEPEGLSSEEYYLNGISTSLPPEVQMQMLRSLPGLESVHIVRYAYAIEYDFVFPHALDSSLAVRKWPNLFLAGQINGTSGYEEAAGQGLAAGINAALYVRRDHAPVTFGRDQAYLGVLIDDLITKDIIEPYRLFTSRAEHRLLLRQDNADRRLMPIGHELGLVAYSDYKPVLELEKDVEENREKLRNARHQGVTLWDLLKRPGSAYCKLPDVPKLPDRLVEQLEIEARYEGYIKRARKQAESLKRLEAWKIPASFDYNINGLRNEAKLKLEKTCPENLAQASRIDGVTPAEISLLQVHVSRRQKQKN